MLVALEHQILQQTKAHQYILLELFLWLAGGQLLADMIQLTAKGGAIFLALFMQGALFIQILAHSQVHGTDAVIEVGEEKMGLPALLAGTFDDQLNKAEANLGQYIKRDTREQLPTQIGQALTHGTIEIKLCDKALQFITQLQMQLFIITGLGIAMVWLIFALRAMPANLLIDSQ